MGVNLFAVGGIVISAISLLAFLIVNYDRIILRYLSYRYHPEIEIGISLGEDEFFESEPVSITQLNPYADDLMFGIGLANSGDFDCEIDLTVAVNHMMKTPIEYFDGPNQFKSGYTVETVFHGTGGKPPKRYNFSTTTLRGKSFQRSINFVLEMNPDEVKVFKSARVELIADVQADASVFSIPLLNQNFPENIGKVDLGTIERQYEILGPHHDEVDLSEFKKSQEDVTEIEIEHPHGYLLDSEGRVVSRFAGFSPGVHTVSDDVVEVEYVDDRTSLDREVHPEHKPDPPDPPWEE